MKLSIMLFPFSGLLKNGTMSPRQLVQFLVDCGITGIEPMASHETQLGALSDEFEAACADQGLAVSCLDRNVNLIGNSVADRETALDVCKRALERARDVLHCNRVMLYGTRPSEGMSNEDGRRIYGDMLHQAGEFAKGSGVRFCIEDFGMTPLFKAHSSHCREVLDIAGNEIGFTFDNGNFLLADETPLEAFPVVKDRIAHAHFKDFRIPENGQGGCVSVSGVHYVDAELGTGVCAVPECVALLKKADYTDWLSMEVTPNLEQTAREARLLRRLWEA